MVRYDVISVNKTGVRSSLDLFEAVLTSPAMMKIFINPTEGSGSDAESVCVICFLNNIYMSSV